MMEMYEDETTCGPLCQHPACWQSSNRKVKNIPRKAYRPPSPEDSEYDLPTVKVCNMLEDYGDDDNDKYPTSYGGRALHDRNTSKSLPNLQGSNRKTSIKQTPAPVTSPASPDSKLRQQEERNKKMMKCVEVQEVFDIEDLNSTWDDTFIAKQYYVWIPNKKKKLTPIENVSISQLSKAGPKKILVRDMTEDMIPSNLEYERYMNNRSPEYSYTGPVLKKKRAVMSPCSSKYGRTPYSAYSSREFRSATMRPIIDTDGIEELLDLPRDILIQVLEHTRQSDFSSREKIHEVIQKFLPPFDRMYTNASAASSELLQQRKVQLHEGKARNIRQSHLMETKPVFYLDNEGVDNEDEEEEEPRDHRFDSDYGSIRDLYMNKSRDFARYRRPLPAIGDRADSGYQKIPSISLGLPELPSGVKHTKTFTYNKKNYSRMDLTIGPVPSPPISSRDSVEPLDLIGSDHGTTVKANIPSPSSPRQQLVGVPMSLEDRKALETRSVTPSRSTPLHAVSPATSTKVPQAPASTPAKQQSPVKGTPLPVEVPSGEMLARTNTGTSSPTQNIRAPVNSPRDASPERERTGLGTIEEKRSEDSNAPVSRSRNVRFATEELPEIPPPPSSPQEDEVAASEVSGVVTHQATSTVATNANTINTRDPTLTEHELLTPGDRKRESTMTSTPEPWPSVNEADFDVTPASTKLALHSDSVMKNKRTPVSTDSRQAHFDAQSDRGSLMAGKLTTRSDDASQVSTISTKKPSEVGKAESPGPPPPSPEAKDTNVNKNSVEEARTARRRDLRSRESVTMEPLIEEHEDQDTGPVKTIVVSVPPLGNTGKPRSKNYRTIDTFISIDIPAASPDSSVTQSEVTTAITKKAELETHAEETSEVSDNDGLASRTINTREQVLSQMSSIGERTVDGQETMSDVTSAGVAPSIGGNVSPTSTLTGGAKGPGIDLKIFMEDQGEGANSGNSKIIEEETERNNEDDDDENKVPEITEEGGDHEGFKQELREEFERMSGDGKEDCA